MDLCQIKGAQYVYHDRPVDRKSSESRSHTIQKSIFFYYLSSPWQMQLDRRTRAVSLLHAVM